MVKLELEEYCKNCPDFSVHQDTSVWAFGKLTAIHTLTCEHRNKCKAIKEYLVKNQNEEKTAEK